MHAEWPRLFEVLAVLSATGPKESFGVLAALSATGLKESYGIIIVLFSGLIMVLNSIFTKSFELNIIIMIKVIIKNSANK